MIVSYIKLSVEPVTAIVAVLNQELDESPINNINFKSYFCESWPMEISAGGILLCTGNQLPTNLQMNYVFTNLQNSSHSLLKF